ncbi:hypothetical protein V2I01_00250 [Micromonospora sp. BRA006-A]|nr:hypothetical protein [Micromonospora sp. BRA006-A]
MLSVIVVQVFKNVGLNMVLFLAALRACRPICTRPPRWTARAGCASSGGSPCR